MSAQTPSSLTPRERVSKAIRGLKPDKLPTVVINSNTFMCQYYGVSVEDYCQKPDVCARVNIDFIKEFQVDCNLVCTGYILYGAGPELGVEWRFAGANFPGHIKSPLGNESDLKKMRVPEAPSGYFKNYLEAITMIVEELGQTHHLKASFLGPFSLFCFLRGIEPGLLDLMNRQEFFREAMEHCTRLSVYLGQNLLTTGLRYPILNEIFLAPGMMSPAMYHLHVAPYVMEVQRQIGIEIASNCFTFMGLPGNPESVILDKALYAAFFGVGESLDSVALGSKYRAPGFPYPAAISGRALDNWPTSKIVEFIKKALEILTQEKGIYPAISYSSVQAYSREKAREIADKIKTVNALRDEYSL